MEEFKILIFFITIIISGIVFNKLAIKNNFLLNYNGSIHQKFTKNKLVPLTGGFLLLSLLLLNFSINKYLDIFIILFFLLGFLGDHNFLKSAKIRFYLQLIFLLILVNVCNLSIHEIRFDFFDSLLKNEIFNISFTILCLMILINGTNFIDGCNTLVVGYFLVVSLVLFKLNLLNTILIEEIMIYYLFSILLAIFILNFFQKLFLGDSGAYILSLLFGIILIDLYKSEPSISPYFVCILLWYPSFEVFFSIIRKINSKTSVLKPDTQHLHQLIYFFLNKKITKINSILINSLTSNIINAYNLFIFLLASNYFYKSEILIYLIICNIIVYCFLYISLYKFRFPKKKI
jgi:UDP-N-acetylmuramyl pentapeptide phosphotransferase/UDP-N-acetylglucosamine-1-phosphate transferase